jgi:hypothetical protein
LGFRHRESPNVGIEVQNTAARWKHQRSIEKTTSKPLNKQSYNLKGIGKIKMLNLLPLHFLTHL